MDAKTYLKRIREIDMRIENKQMELESLYSLIQSITVKPKEVDVQSSPKLDKLESTIAKIVDLKTEINSCIDLYVDMKYEAIKMIHQIHNEEFEAILFRRYVKYESWAEVARALGCSRQTVDKKHDLALTEFDTILHHYGLI